MSSCSSTSPTVNKKLLKKPLGSKRRARGGRWATKPHSNLSYISDLDDGITRSILRDFLNDAAFVKENVRSAVRAKPEDM